MNFILSFDYMTDIVTDVIIFQYLQYQVLFYHVFLMYYSVNETSTNVHVEVQPLLSLSCDNN